MPVLSPAEYNNALRVITSALAEDLGEAGDLTSQALVDPRAIATIHVVVREPGVVAGLPLGKVVFRELDADVSFVQKCEDGTFVGAASIVAEVTGSVQSLLTGERTA